MGPSPPVSLGKQVPGPRPLHTLQHPRLATCQTLYGAVPVYVSWPHTPVSSLGPSATASASGSALSPRGPAGAAQAARSSAQSMPAMQVLGRPGRTPRAEYPLRLYRGRPCGGAVRAVAARPRTLDNYRFMQALRGPSAAMRGRGGLRQRAGRGPGGAAAAPSCRRRRWRIPGA